MIDAINNHYEVKTSKTVQLLIDRYLTSVGAQ